MTIFSRLAALLAVAVTLAASPTVPAFASVNPGTDQVYLVSGTTPDNEISAVGGELIRRMPYAGIDAAHLTPAEAAILDAKPGVTVELSKPVQLYETTPPPSWGLDRIDGTLDNTYTRPATENGAGVTAYVLDSGIRPTPAEFGDRLRPGITTILDGYGSSDCNGHGTHVAGTIGGATVGVAPGVTLVPVRILDCTGLGSDFGFVQAADWIIADHQAGTPALVNVSIGFAGGSALVDVAVTRMIEDGITVVVAAGNSATNSCNTSPARVPAVITVGSVSKYDGVSNFSNTGPCLDVFAPGEDITSISISSPTGYGAKYGTSMAAPHAAGWVARYLQNRPDAPPATVHLALIGASKTGAVYSLDASTPNRMLDADPSGVANRVAPPSEPRGLTVTQNRYGLVISWVAPLYSGSSPVNGYLMTAVDQKGFTRTSATTSTSTFMMGVEVGFTYEISVRAFNSYGMGGLARMTAQTYDLTIKPGAPMLPAVLPGPTSCLVSGLSTPPVVGASPVTSYKIYANAAGSPTVVATSPGEPVSVSPLTPGVRYTITVKAVNLAGEGPESTAVTCIPKPALTLPSAPGPVTVTIAGGNLTATWTAPSSAGNTKISGYQVTLLVGGIPGGQTTTGTSRKAVFPVTAGKSYAVVVAAINEAGAGPASQSVEVTAPQIVPNQVSNLAATVSGLAAITATWTKPVSGPAATNYLVTLTAADSQVTSRLVGSSTGKIVFSQLVTGTTYTVTVVSVNKFGQSPSASVSLLLPVPIPAAPTGITATRSTAGATTVSWTPGAGPAASLYLVTVTDVSSGTVRTLTSVKPTIAVYGLLSKKAYQISVVASNSYGSSPTVTVTVTL